MAARLPASRLNHPVTTPAMEATNINLQHYNLTGQVRIVDGIARFNGNYSSVLLGAWNGRYVAIKVIKATSGQHTSTVQRKLLREVVVWGSTTHRNVHIFCGFATDPAFGPFGALISPWCSNGDASQYLSQNGPSMLLDTRVNLWKGVIEGVAYLHGSNPPIVHGDLKPGNVLIDDAGQPKLCDFGLARMLATMQGSGMTTTSDHTGTTRYLAPELVNSDESVPPTISSDLYALGCLGLDFIYLQIPFSHWPSSRQGHIKILQDLKKGVPPATAPLHSTWPSQHFWPIISRLWSLNPAFRPSALSTAQAVMRTEVTFPPNVVQRIILFVEAAYTGRFPRSRKSWTTRTRCLRSLCLVSRAYSTSATPVLYRNLWLGRDDKASTLLTLIDAIISSITSPLIFNRITGGYGMYTESVAIDTTSDSLHRGAVATEFQELLQKMPCLRLVLIGFDYGTLPVHSLATLDICYGFSRVFIVDLTTTIRAFSYLQRLCITCYGGEPAFPGASSRLFLPHLRAITICIEIKEKTQKVSSVFFLGALSGWILPSLQHLEIKSRNEDSYPAALIGFLSAHGSALLYLTLELIHLGNGMSQDLCARILTLCANLQSMQVEVAWPSFHRLPFHANLKRFHVTLYDKNLEADETGEIYERFKEFKSMAQTLFPKLVTAKVTEKYAGWEVLFNTGDYYITETKQLDRNGTTMKRGSRWVRYPFASGIIPGILNALLTTSCSSDMTTS